MQRENKLFSPAIYDSWKPVQLEKYRDLLPHIEKELKQCKTLLDLGVGKAWLEEFLEKQGFKFKRVLGVDVNQEAVTPKRDYIEYLITYESELVDETFDLVISFDSMHLLNCVDLCDYVKPKGFLLVSLPLKWKKEFDNLDLPVEPLAEGKIGSRETDYFKFWQV